MAKKSTGSIGRKAEDYAIGEMLYEGDYSAGVIVSKVQCPERSSRVFMLLCNDKRNYTIYSVIKNAVCAPVVARMIPESVIERMFLEAFYETEIPEELADSPPDRIPVLKKRRKKS